MNIEGCRMTDWRSARAKAGRCCSLSIRGNAECKVGRSTPHRGLSKTGWGGSSCMHDHPGLLHSHRREAADLFQPQLARALQHRPRGRDLELLGRLEGELELGARVVNHVVGGRSPSDARLPLPRLVGAHVGGIGGQRGHVRQGRLGIRTQRAARLLERGCGGLHGRLLELGALGRL